MCDYECPADLNEKEIMRKVFVGNIQKDTTDDMLKEHFSQFGEVTEMEIVRKEGSPKIFGFVTYSTCDEVDECLSKRPHKLSGKELHMKRNVPKDDTSDTAHQKSKKLFVGNVPADLTEEALRTYLEARHPAKYGKITDIVLVKKTEGEKQINKGFGFITCENEDLADRISMGDRMCKVLEDQPKELEIKKARSKDQPTGFGGRGRGRGDMRGGARGARGGRGGRGGMPMMHGGYGGGYGGGFAGYGGGYGGYGAYGSPYAGYGGYGGW